MTFNKNIFNLVIMAFILLCIVPFHSYAKLTIQTRIATGIIVEIQDNIIQLEGGAVYYPAKERLTLAFHPGDFLTLRFYVDPEEKNYYVDAAPGKNSLPASPQPEQRKRKTIY